jgi:NADPH-dependent 2,4-dienoyl-CoA reductase/sulfur reductase-like enzyme
LSEGVAHEGRVVCPWHKAAFCLRTGRVEAPPAVDCLTVFDVQVKGGRIWVEERRAEPPMTAVDDGRVFAIIGGGAAGAVAAQTLREAGFGGRIVVFDRENRVPYDRTVLSKYFLSGEQGAEKSPLQSQAYYREQRIERLTEMVISLDVAERNVVCASGTRLRFDAALVAAGAAPVPAEITGTPRTPVFTLRGRADADALLAQAERATRAVVFGASFIGMEVAASLRERGLEVLVVAQESVPFEKHLGPEVGGALQRLHARHGVMFRLGRTVTAVEDGAVVLDDGARVGADLVVVGHGVRPATNFLVGADMDEDGGVHVDAGLRVAGEVFAAGDVARFPLFGDGPALRVEHWRVAQQHGRIAALNMLGRGVRYEAVPVFWTIQYLKRVDYVGHAASWDSVVLHGDLDKPEFIIYYVKDGVVAAAAGMDRDVDMAALVVLFEKRRDWTVNDLGAHPAIVLSGLVAD